MMSRLYLRMSGYNLV